MICNGRLNPGIRYFLISISILTGSVPALDDGAALFKSGRLSAARAQFERRYMTSKADREAVAYLARLEPNPARASALLSLLADGQSQDIHAQEALHRIAQHAYAAGDYGGAIQSWNRLLKGYPASTLRDEALLWKGFAFLSDNRPDSATEALALVAQNAGTRYGRAQAALGLLLSRQGRLPEAREHLNNAHLSRTPEVMPPVLLQLFRNSLALADTAGARKAGTELLRDWPASLEGHAFSDADRLLLTPAPLTATASGSGMVSPQAFTLQLGAFKSRDNADKLKKKMDALPRAKSCEIFESARNGGTFFLVRMGRFPNREEAIRFAADTLRLKPEEFKVMF